MSISTHVLNAVTGRPATDLTVHLSRRDGGDWQPLASATTDSDGRVAGFVAGAIAAGSYRLTFDTDAYLDGDTFYPEVVITFRITDPAAHHHVPLLLSPYAYSTYRGS